MEGINNFALGEFRMALWESGITILNECTDRYSYMFIIEDTVIAPSELKEFSRVWSCGLQLTEYDGRTRLCFYILKEL